MATKSNSIMQKSKITLVPQAGPDKNISAASLWSEIDATLSRWEGSNKNYRIRLGELFLPVQAAYSRKSRESADIRLLGRRGTYLQELARRNLKATTVAEWIHDFKVHRAKLAGEAAALTASQARQARQVAQEERTVTVQHTAPDVATFPVGVGVTHVAPDVRTFDVKTTTTRTEFDPADFAVEEASDLRDEMGELVGKSFENSVRIIKAACCDIEIIDLGDLIRLQVDIQPLKVVISKLMRLCDALEEPGAPITASRNVAAIQ